jgi:integrase
MKRMDISLIGGTAALAPLEQVAEEFAKDKWDARLIPGLRYAPHTTNYYIDFQHIPQLFRPVVKEHIKCKLATGVSAGMLHLCTYCLGNFLTFFVKQYPHAQTLQALSKQDIDTFILALKAEGEARDWKANDSRIHNHISCLEELLCYLERVQSPLRPTDSPPHIIWPSHFPRLRRPRAQAKDIPQTVLDQLDTHPQHLLPTYIPIVILLRASGWRISDVLYLKLDTCLEQDGEKFWLVGDIQKTRVLGHKIPITKEVAAVILTQIEWVKQHYTPEENPKQWLFPALKCKPGFASSQRFIHGDPLNAKNVSRALDSLVKQYQLCDEAGNLFHFKLHAFRHTKGIELVNNGMSLLMVQQWMAHASPEMTLIYAKMLDETMRTQWEKAVQHGIVQFNEGKPEYVPGKKMLTVMNEPQAFDPERVRNYRANTKLPVGNCVKSPKLLCKFTELPCFHCPAYVLTPDDLPALETYEQHILERIEIGKQANNAYWIEVNQKNLDERVRPAIAMLKQGQIVAKNEKYEREYTPEEWEHRQAQQAEAKEETR